MNNKLAQIEFIFPNNTDRKINKNTFCDLLIDIYKKRKLINFSGYKNISQLRNDLSSKIDDKILNNYKTLKDIDKTTIKHVIARTITKCNKILPIPIKNYIFILPNMSKMNKKFAGVLGSAKYICVLYIYLSQNKWTKEGIEDTVAHELNHTIYYYYNFSNFGHYNLLDNIIIEGIAENFREAVFPNKISAPWSITLKKQEAFNVLNLLTNKLKSKNTKLHNEILYGNNKYKKWTGYSIGYWIIKALINNHPSLSFSDIIKLNSNKIIKIYKKRDVNN